MLRFKIALICAIGVTGVVGGCSSSDACTSLGCPVEFQVNFEKQTWEPGTYRIATNIDGFASSCDITLPFKDCETWCQLSGSAGNADVFLTQSGCALDSSQHRLDGILLAGIQPTDIQVEVSFEGVVIGNGVYAPTYTRSTPNGAECEPVCLTAEPETLVM